MPRPRVYGIEVRTKIRELYKTLPIKAIAADLSISHMTVRRELGFEPAERRTNRKKKPPETC